MQAPNIKRVDIDKIVQQGEKIEVIVNTDNADSILYFIINSKEKIQFTKELKINENKAAINITSKESEKLQVGANSIKIFAISNSVLKPDFYESSFLVSETNLEEPKTTIDSSNIENEINYNIWIIGFIVIVIIIVITLYLKIYSKP